MTLGGAAVMTVIARSLIRLPWPWFVVLGVGLALIGLGLIQRAGANAGFTVRAYSHAQLLRLTVTNTGATSDFEATVVSVDVVGPGERKPPPFPQFQLKWSDQPGRRCEIPSKASHDLEVAHANGFETGDDAKRYSGTVTFSRPNDGQPYNAQLGEPFDGDEITITVRVTRIRPARSLIRSYNIRFRPTDRLPYKGQVWPVFQGVDGSDENRSAPQDVASS